MRKLHVFFLISWKLLPQKETTLPTVTLLLKVSVNHQGTETQTKH